MKLKVILCSLLVLSACSQPTDEDFNKTLVRYGCTATNEFVGKNAERLYLCSDGLKYTHSSIFYTTYRDIREEKK